MPKFDVSRKQLGAAPGHGRALGAVVGLEDAGRVIETVADAMMTSEGSVNRYRERLVGRIEHSETGWQPRYYRGLTS